MEAHLWDSERTVVVSGVPDHGLSPGRMVDKLTVHFQSRRRSGGGDVERVTYPTNTAGLAYVTFDKAEDAAQVLQKKPQILSDDAFPEGILLTIFPFTSDMSIYVPGATLDLSIFGSDQASLIESLRSAHSSLRFQPLPHLGQVTVEGPFAALKALRHDLIRQARALQTTVPPSTAGLSDSLLNPSVMSRFDSSGSLGEDNGSSYHNWMEPVKESDLSVQTRLEDVPVFSSKEARHTEESSMDTDIYVDAYTFQYIQKFDRKELDRCVEGFLVSAKCVEGSSLMKIQLSETTVTISSARRALKNLSRLVEHWMSILRVHQITFDERIQPHMLVQICKDVSLTLDDVLYVFEDTCMTVVGSSVSSLHFYQNVLDRVIAKSPLDL